MHQHYLEGFLQHRLLSSVPQILDSMNLDCGLRTCISNEFPDQADAGGREKTHFG